MHLKNALLLTPALALAACAPAPDSVAPAYVSPAAYTGQSCTRLAAEAQRLDAALTAATGAQKKQADADAAMVAISLFVFWPAAFMVAGGDQSPQLARLKGEAQALQQAARAKGCAA